MLLLNSVAKKSVVIFVLVFIISAALLTSPIIVVPATGATGTFVDSKFVGGLNSPTAMDFSPDGRLFVNEKGGSMRIVKSNMLLATPFLTVTVDSVGERGLLGLAFDPNFATNGYVYAYYTATSPTTHNRVSRFTVDPANPDKVLAGSEVQILNLETLSTATNHNGGAIHFGKDGKLYVAVGDNANSSNSQTLTSRFGKILRINSDGSIPTDNPYYNTSGAYKEIWALGLRNPFTFAFSPSATSTSMYINDVGLNTWEEINSGVKGANYGWPTCEGVCSNTSFVNPIYAYNHNGAGAAIAGAAFYESTQFPSEYKDSYFFGDYVLGFIKRLTPTNQAVDFLSGLNSPVDIKIGPDGSLFYLSIGAGEVHKVQYNVGTNSNPIAIATASPTSGAVPLAVTFNGTKSSDPDPNTTLGYSWNFGDGSSVATGALVTHTYAKAGPYVATLTVTDGVGGIGTATVNIAVGTPPVGTIVAPAEGTKYNAGDTIFFSGTGSDAEDGILPASAFHWTILLHHNTHTHPFLDFAGVKSGNFTIPTVGETSSDVWYRIYLTVTDSSGLSQTTTRDVTPNKSSITLSSNVPGLQVTLDGIPEITPYSFVGVVGFNRTLGAPDPQSLNGQTYQFSSWSDGGAATHTIITPSTNTTYTGNYTVSTLPPPPPPPTTSKLTISSQDNATGNPITGMWTVLKQGTVTVSTGFTPTVFTLNNGLSYTIGASNYGNFFFDHWLDNGSTVNPRAITLPGDPSNLVAVYLATATTTSPKPTNLSENVVTASPMPWGASLVVSGRLTESQTGTGISGAIVSLSGNGTSGLTSLTTTTASDGTFSFVGAAPSNVGRNWVVQSHYAGNSAAPYAASDSQVRAYDTILHQVSLTLAPSFVDVPWGRPIAFNAILKDATGAGNPPIQSAQIHFDGTGVIGVADTLTDSTGRAMGTGTSPSSVASGWTARAHYLGSAKYAPADSATISYTTTAHDTGLTLAILPSTVVHGTGTYKVTGIITDQVTGTQLASKTIAFTATNPITITATATDATGTYTVSGLKAPSKIGSYQITAKYAGEALYLSSSSPTGTLNCVNQHGG